MIQQADRLLLDQIRQAISAYRLDKTDIGPLADKLLTLRDGLTFEDRVWFYQLTQHIATLDSASTFVPEGAPQERQLYAAITAAADSLLALVEQKSST